MNKRERQQVDAIRRQSNEIQNHVIDEFERGRMSRREFLRKGSIVGLTLPFVGVIAAACSSDDDTATTIAGATTTTAAGATTTAATQPPAGPTTVRVGINPAPSEGIEPVLINDEAGLAAFGQTAQYLVFSDDELTAVPVLATDWRSNSAGDVWEFDIRQGVTFHDGTPLTAADVVATFNGPIADGNAASAYGTFGVTAGSAVALDDFTVQFTLSQPSGAFPFFVSSDNYNAAILPVSFWENYSAGSYEQSFIGTGAWINESFDPGVSAVYTKNPNYWGDNTNQPDRMEVTFFANEAAAVTAFQDDRVDVIHRISPSGGKALIDDPSNTVQSISTAQHRQIYFDTLTPPFDDKRVRQAMALMLDRPLLIDGLLDGFGSVGNDHPIWEFYPMYDPTAVPQREVNLAEAASLLDAAGYADGFTVPLDALEFNEVPELAQLIQSSAAQLPNNINLTVGIYDSGTYYGDFWLAAQGSMGIVNYGHRGVPNVYLGAPLLTPPPDQPGGAEGGLGTWNASHWARSEYDALFNQFVTSPDLETQRGVAGQIQTLLNDEVPFIVPYYLDFISILKSNFSGFETTGMGHYDVLNSGFTG
jgi:peptide/nickel transport system substrate-binding protein